MKLDEVQTNNPITCRLERPMVEWIKEQAKKNHRSTSQEIRHLLAGLMEEDRKVPV